MPPPGAHPALQRINIGLDISSDEAKRTSDIAEASVVDLEDSIPTTTPGEVASWYMYSVGASGIGLLYIATAAFQNLLDQAALTRGGGLLMFLGSRRHPASIVLLANSVSFAVQGLLALFIGVYADFGRGRRWIIILWSVLGWAVSFAWLGVYERQGWEAGVALYIVGTVAFQLATTYWTASFPSLARNSKTIKDAVKAYRQGEIGRDELDRREQMERSRLSNVSFTIQSIGAAVILAISIGIMHALRADMTTRNNNWAFSVVIAFAGVMWLVLSLPWFIMQRTRPGLSLPPGKTYATIGIWRFVEACKQIWTLRQSLFFLMGFFMIGNCFITSLVLIVSIQNKIIKFNAYTVANLLMVSLASQGIGITMFWQIQQRFKLSVKTMFNATMVSVLMVCIWGLVGNWTNHFGFYREWEVWAFSIFSGLFSSPFVTYGPLMISCVTPAGHEFLFFSLFNTIGKASIFLGPLVCSAIIDVSPTHSVNAPFYFLTPLAVVSIVAIWGFVDLDKSAKEQQLFLAKEQAVHEEPKQ